MLTKIFGALTGVLIFLFTLYGLLFSFERFKATPNNKKFVKSEIVDGNFTEIVSKVGNKTFVAKFNSKGIRLPFDKIFNFTANGIVEATHKKDDKLIFKATYTLNPWGMREVKPLYNTVNSKHLIIGPCSFSFGEGLEDADQISAFIERDNKYYNNYNFGISGGGLQNLLLLFLKTDIHLSILEKEGVFIFLFIPNHLNRWFGRLDFLHHAYPMTPVFSAENKKIILKGLLKDQKDYKNFVLLKKMGLSETKLRTSRMLKDPNYFSNKEYSEFAFAIKEFEKLYLSRFPNSRFYFLFHPLFPLDKELLTLKAFLLDNGINVWSLDKAFSHEMVEKKRSHLDYVIPFDGHPNQLMNKFLADQISIILSGPHLKGLVER